MNRIKCKAGITGALVIILLLMVLISGGGCTTIPTEDLPTITEISLSLVSATATATATPTPTPTPSPTPTTGQAAASFNIMAAVILDNFNVVDKQGQAAVAGEGHLHFYLDAVPSVVAGQPAIPPENTPWAHVADTVYTFTGLTPGFHAVSVELVNNDHTPLSPPVVAAAAIVVPAATVSGAAAVTPTPTPTKTPTPTAELEESFDITASNLAFDTNSITVATGAQVTINFDNQDSGIPHNISFYYDQYGTQSIFVGDIITGPATTTYTFTAPSTPGTYFFRCDVHPTTMTGSFVVVQ